MRDADSAHMFVSGDRLNVALMGINEHGGQISVFGREGGKPRVLMHVTEKGHGEVGVFDKHGYNERRIKP